MKSSIPFWVRHHGINVSFCSLIALGLLEAFTDWMPADDTIPFFFLCGFMAGSVYMELHKSALKKEDDEITKRLHLQSENVWDKSDKK